MAKEQEFEYRNVADHPVDLHDGSIVEVGGYTTLTKDALREDHNQQLVADGMLIPTDDKAGHEAQLAERREETKTKEEGGS